MQVSIDIQVYILDVCIYIYIVENSRYYTKNLFFFVHFKHLSHHRDRTKRLAFQPGTHPASHLCRLFINICDANTEISNYLDYLLRQSNQTEYKNESVIVLPVHARLLVNESAINEYDLGATLGNTEQANCTLTFLM